MACRMMSTRVGPFSRPVSRRGARTLHASSRGLRPYRSLCRAVHGDAAKAAVQDLKPSDGVRCVVNEEGHLVCERLEPGDYVVRSTSGANPVGEDIAEGDSTYCYITDDGELLCEGLNSGEYTIEKASEDDIEDMLAHVEALSSSMDEVSPTSQESTTAGATLQEPVGDKPVQDEPVASDDGVRCFVTAEGHMVCERLEPGEYKVKSAEGDKPVGEVAPQGTFCYITDDGQLICEGLPEGNYTIEQAGDEDMEAMLEHMKKLDSA